MKENNVTKKTEEVDESLPEELKEVLKVAKKTGNFKEIKLSENLMVSFVKTQENHINCGLDICLDYGNLEGPIFHFTKLQVKSEKWKELISESIEDCGRNFSETEIRDISTFALSAIQKSNVEEDGEKMSLTMVIRNLYELAKVYMSKEKPKESGRSVKTITLLEGEKYLSINGNSKETQAILDEIESGWEHLEFKRCLKHKGLLIAKVDKYYDVIQTDEAKAMGVRKIIKIPVDKIRFWIGEEADEQ